MVELEVLVVEAQQLKAKIDTPKGGHAGDLLARAGQQAITACGPRSKMKFKKGAYGSGTCADELWSLQAGESALLVGEQLSHVPRRSRCRRAA